MTGAHAFKLKNHRFTVESPLLLLKIILKAPGPDKLAVSKTLLSPSYRYKSWRLFVREGMKFQSFWGRMKDLAEWLSVGTPQEVISAHRVASSELKTDSS